MSCSGLWISFLHFFLWITGMCVTAFFLIMLFSWGLFLSDRWQDKMRAPKKPANEKITYWYR